MPDSVNVIAEACVSGKNVVTDFCQVGDTTESHVTTAVVLVAGRSKAHRCAKISLATPWRDKVVRACDSSASGICQYPDRASMVVKSEAPVEIWDTPGLAVGHG